MKSDFKKEIQNNGYILYTSLGYSMKPLINQKTDILFISKLKRRPKKYDIVLYKRDNGQYVLHRIVNVKKSGYVLCGDNQCKKEYGITDSHIIGILEKIIRKDKTLRLNDKKYIIYAHLWTDFFYIRAFIIYFKNFISRHFNASN